MLQHQEQQAKQNTPRTTIQTTQSNESLWGQDSRTNVVYTPEETPLDFEELHAFLKTETARVKKQKRVINYCIGSFSILVVGMITYSGIVRHDWDFTAYLGMTGVFSAGASAVLGRKGKEAINQLSQFNDVRMVGVFVEVLETTEPSIISIAVDKLTELLPRLQASDTGLLNAEQRAILNRQLLKADKDFALAIVKAYEQVGDSTAIANVEKLAHGEGKAGNDAEVTAAANACLPFLVERAKQREQSATLLRASNETASAPETLLRPASAALETQPETLLRPTQN